MALAGDSSDDAATVFDRIIHAPLMKLTKPCNLPLPVKFPATLKDFFNLIVKAKTPADCTCRLRQFLCEKMRPASLPRDAHWADNPLKDAERSELAIHEIQKINSGDKQGGYFTEEIWRGMGSAYRYWWAKQKSIKASESAKKRRPRS